ncbi:MAG: hypothetical protein K9J16_00175 [Melioribacteraceae bacterium]|nr:hypothetical protein [Melioribacteraceae bacterium]MCF8353925.1 hypothetical protein [Melioribacteraceae bacterium]MCF8392682.1 hypothetical protein [Melioribacteraceae bacterium]MCF8417703.1 hypothetical protein [Melioribacteraceae bacterium]
MYQFTFILDSPFEINLTDLTGKNKSLTTIKQTQNLPCSPRLVLRSENKVYRFND